MMNDDDDDDDDNNAADNYDDDDDDDYIDITGIFVLWLCMCDQAQLQTSMYTQDKYVHYKHKTYWALLRNFLQLLTPWTQVFPSTNGKEHQRMIQDSCHVPWKKKNSGTFIANLFSFLFHQIKWDRYKCTQQSHLWLVQI